MCEQFRDFMGVLYTYISDVTLLARYQKNTDMFNWAPCTFENMSKIFTSYFGEIYCVKTLAIALVGKDFYWL